MRIADQTVYRNIDRGTSSITEQMRNINNQITSGRRLNRPSDDPGGMVQALSIKEAVSQIEQWDRNSSHVQSWLQTTESALQTTEDLVRRAKEIATQMASDTYNAGQRRSAAREVQGIFGQLIQVSNTQLNGRYIFSGNRDHSAAYADDLRIREPLADAGNNPAYMGEAASSGTFTGLTSKQYVLRMTTGGAVGTAKYQVSEDGGLTWGPADAFTTSTAPTAVYGMTDQGAMAAFSNSGTLTVGDQFTIAVSRYNGDAGEIEAQIGKTARIAVNLSGDAVFGEAAAAGNLFDILIELKQALESNDSSGIGSSMERMKTFEEGLNGNQAEIGARLNRVDTSKAMLTEVSGNQQKRLSAIEDIDVVKAVTDLNAKQTVYQAVLYSAGQISRLSLMDYLK